VSWTHHVCILADLVLLVWFFGRLGGDDSWHFWRAPFRRKVALCWLPAAVLAVDLFWLEVPGPASRTVGRDLTTYLGRYPEAPASFMEQVGWWVSFQPIDLLLCTPGAWGCRFLTVTHRIIVGKVWDTSTFVALRAGADVDAKHRASFEVASLRQRTLRFANLTASELFAGDLTGTDLSQATLSYAQLEGAYLVSADLTGADLFEANLTWANLDLAHLNGAHLIEAHLNGAALFEAYLTGANLTYAHLNATNLTGANLIEAYLTDANLTQARLNAANLTRANLIEAYLTDANLTHARLNAANLTRANLFAADLTDADLSGANLTDAARLTQSQLDKACGTDTKLPPGLILNKPCPDK
jgi:uncharacterized protein YjbI with pentapeptide repeats